ncbi:LptF/LptG family permease [Carboxylicivirga sediminis]|uniref:LptF/LptG family permease n=1 Tax=Carboxylicivirga sediminis TaxID=2006564 RepID=A0A941F892_9BACT|nr:LptF/LptG family permease [Carboxylicivirga sediminis]MBR8538254.1 LptF/LptG family permease [Carboxylicivirga sediminis]
MKKLHLFILKSYLGPLAMTFFISLFILVMQFLWRYVDDLVGKGLDFFTLAELMFYASVQVIPMALPLAILLASLMTFGSLGENYELTAIKASGVSLLRTMKSLIYVTIIISVLAFGFSNNVLPWANLKLYTLLWSVKQKKPELEIKEQIFYDGIEDFRIKISSKDPETGLMQDVMIYDHRDSRNPNSNVTLADSGKLQVSEDNGYMKLTLMDGIRFEENVQSQRKRLDDREKQRFRQDKFKKQIALFEMEGHNLERSDEKLFSSNDRMKNLTQLKSGIDTLNMEKNTLLGEVSKQTENFFFQQRRYYQRRNKEAPQLALDSVKSLDYDSLLLAMNDHQKLIAIEGAKRQAQDNRSQLEGKLSRYKNYRQKITRHYMEVHRKFTLSFACFIFFFIGAPLGAIIRKGGLGMPVVISVLFFIFYYIIDTLGAKFANEGAWKVYQGMWLSSAILFPLGVFLTYKSATDSTLLNADAYRIFFQKLFKREKFDLQNRLDREKEDETKSKT